MYDDELISCLVLASVEGLGPIRFAALISRYGKASVALAQHQVELARFAGPAIAARIVDCQNSPGVRLQIERLLASSGDQGIRAVAFTSLDYPSSLKNIVDPPPVIWVKGSLPNDAVRVAVVGTRRATPYGRKVAGWISAELATTGVEIVSGMAYGIDSAAHSGAMTAPGRTTAVLGTSIESALTGSSAEMARRIVSSGGALVSEHSVGTPTVKGFFAARNRVISGMSRAVIVVEAPEKSGALITAACALDHGKEVMVVPGSLFAATYAGCHALIRDGATLVRGAADVLIGLGYGRRDGKSEDERNDTAPLPSQDSDAVVFSALRDDAVSFEYLVEATGLDPVALATSLGMLEIKGLARRTSAGWFERIT